MLICYLLQKYYEAQMSVGREHQQQELRQLKNERKNLLLNIHKKDAVIQMLRAQVQKYVGELCFDEVDIMYSI